MLRIQMDNQVKKKQQKDKNMRALMLRLQMAKQVKKKQQQDRNMEASMLSLLLAYIAEGARMIVDDAQLLLVNTTIHNPSSNWLH